MTSQELATVLGWSMVVNFAIYLVWLAALKLVPDLTCKTQGLVTSISREDFDRIIYKMMANYKILMLVTHFGPYVSIRGSSLSHIHVLRDIGTSCTESRSHSFDRATWLIGKIRG